jgi:histidine triad (HIT) family protein
MVFKNMLILIYQFDRGIFSMESFTCGHYDDSNVFARILRGELACRKIIENDVALAFHDAFPRAPIHCLIIPKGPYIQADAFFSKASPAEIAGFCSLLGELPALLGVQNSGYRLISNAGADSGQEVPHFHMHLLAGKPLGAMA